MTIAQVTIENGSDMVNIPEGSDVIGIAMNELISGMGEALFGLFIASFVLFMLYYASGGHIGVPAVIMTLSSAWAMSVIPAQYHTTVATIVIVGLGAGVFRITQKYFLRPNA